MNALKLLDFEHGDAHEDDEIDCEICPQQFADGKKAAEAEFEAQVKAYKNAESQMRTQLHGVIEELRQRSIQMEKEIFSTLCTACEQLLPEMIYRFGREDLLAIVNRLCEGRQRTQAIRAGGEAFVILSEEPHEQLQFFLDESLPDFAIALVDEDHGGRTWDGSAIMQEIFQIFEQQDPQVSDE